MRARRKLVRRLNSRCSLQLFVAGGGANSMAALEVLDSIIAKPDFANQVDMIIIDVERQPAMAMHFGVLATPLLVISTARRTFKLLGDLSRSGEVEDLLRQTLA